MLRRVALLLLGGWLAAGPWCAVVALGADGESAYSTGEAYSTDTQFPYTAYVTVDELYIHSGPGENFYPVQKLRRGESVEVYRHDPDGWYAVRPPRNAFSWISAEFVQPTQGHQGQVIGDAVAVRVGSQLFDVRDVIQLRLDAGTSVEILGVETNGPAEQAWCKIAPPPGEFRWVDGAFVSRTPPSTHTPEGNQLPGRPASPDSNDPKQSVYLTSHDDASRDSTASRDNTASRAASSSQAPRRTPSSPGWHAPGRAPHMASRNTDRGSLDRGSFPSRSTAEDREQTSGRESNGPRDRTASRSTGSDRAADPTTTAQWQTRLDDLELALSEAVSQPASQWQLDELRHDAQHILLRANSHALRGQARILLSKIDRFDDIRARQEALAQDQRLGTSGAGGSTRLNRDPVGRSSGAAGNSGTFSVMSNYGSVSDGQRAPLYDERFDARGRVAQLPVSRPDVPAFALVDERGELITYLTPAPGVGLSAYVGREVGIVGSMGFIPERNAQHLTARRVIDLEGLSLR